jgi:hypothetical protein
MMQFKGGKWDLFGDIISAETGGSEREADMLILKIVIAMSEADDSIQATSLRDAPSGAGPESRDSGFDASHRPGMTVMGLRAEPVIRRAFARPVGSTESRHKSCVP